MDEHELVIDLTVMPSGVRYEDRYGKYLEIFQNIALQPVTQNVVVYDPPYSWIPLLEYLHCRVVGGQEYFEHDALIKALDQQYRTEFDRTAVEVLCGLRPELVD